MFKNLVKKAKKLVDIYNQDPNVKKHLVGNDRQGNNYFLYLDGNGKELKREVEFPEGKIFTDNSVDPNWEAWLRKRIHKPYSSDQVQKINLEEDKRNYMNRAYDEEEKSKIIPKDQKEKEKNFNYQDQFKTFYDAMKAGRVDPDKQEDKKNGKN